MEEAPQALEDHDFVGQQALSSKRPVEAASSSSTKKTHRTGDWVNRKGDANPIVWALLQEVRQARQLAIEHKKLLPGDNTPYNFSEEAWDQILIKLARNIKCIEYKPKSGTASDALPVNVRYCWMSTYAHSSTSHTLPLPSTYVW